MVLVRFLQVFFLIGLVLGASNAIEAKRGSVWPKPVAQVTIDSQATLSANLQVVTNLANCSTLDKAIARYKADFVKTGCQALDEKYGRRRHLKPAHNRESNRVHFQDEIATLEITVQGACEQWPLPDSNEEYSLQVNTPSLQGKVEILSGTIWGAIRGLETFRQLLVEAQDGNGDAILNVNTTIIIDFPRFNYRGLMLDTSRHFIPMHVILDQIEAMSQNKLNVFHWHIVDDQSFPYESIAYPQLSQNGAYSPNHVYSQQDVADVIEFARQRGIRVIPEFDSPGHTQSWGKGVEGILTPCYKGTTRDGTFGPMDPIGNATYDFVTKLLTEVAQVFPDPFLHLGGDEVDFACWKSNPDIIKFMEDKGMGDDFTKLEAYYVQQVVSMAQDKLHKKTLVWQEVIDNHVDLDKKSTIVHVWKDGFKDDLNAVTKAGYNAILSACWYLNQITYGVDWHPYYLCEPTDFPGTDAQKKLIVGGSATMWAEFVDGTGSMTRTWPRASTVAERLWSPAQFNDVNEAAPRLEEQRCRMLQRGLRVEPPNGPGFCPCDPSV